jgi:hypothetical protein
MCGPSRTSKPWGIRTSDWFIVAGGDGFQSRNDPEDPNIVYATSQNGGISRRDVKAGTSTSIRPRVPFPGDEEMDAEELAEARRGRERTNWDAPYIISPHSHTRLYWGGNYLYRSDDRGDSWERISSDLTRDLDKDTLPIMGRVWDSTAVRKDASTTTLSTIVTLDESPLFEGLIYVGTDDGLLQITEDAGENWRRVDEFPDVPRWTYVTDVFPSPRDANTVFVSLNNWQRGDYDPYIVKSADRGHTWTNITGNLPALNNVWSVIQDHENGDLLFAGTEFGVFASFDGGMAWVQLEGGMPPAQVRDMAVQRRENDLVLATFGRGFYVLDDYSPLRDITPEALDEDAVLFGLRDPYLFNTTGLNPAGSAGIADLSGNFTTPNPPTGAVFTYHANTEMDEDQDLVLVIKDAEGEVVRTLDLDADAGLHRATWNLRGETPAAGSNQGQAGGGFNRRARRGPLVEAGRFEAVLAWKNGEDVTEFGDAQSFHVIGVEW